MASQTANQSELIQFLAICVICFSPGIVHGVKKGFCFIPFNQRAYSVCHVETRLQEQQLFLHEPVNVYICVCPVRDSLLDESELTSLRSPASCSLSFPAHSDEILRRFSSRRKTAAQWCLPTHKAQHYSGSQ